MKRILGVLLLTLAAATPAAQGQKFITYDGLRYSQQQIELAARTPRAVPMPEFSGNELSIPRAADGHYYVAGTINGFPVVFLIDTGATSTTIPAQMAKNAGIRAGVVRTSHTANGNVEVGASYGNRLVISEFVISDATVSANPNLSQPLLGMEVLNRFEVNYSNGTMVLRPGR